VAVEGKLTSFGNVNPARSAQHLGSMCYCVLISFKRESSATIKAPPVAYNQASPPTRQKVIEFDCRGLEFIEFKPEVCIIFQMPSYMN